MTEFKSDGCSGGLSRAWRAPTGHPPPFESCCCAHDKLYWMGGTEEERRDADELLRLCIRDRGYKLTSWVVWAAVRLCGGSHFLYSGRHGWGWGGE